MLETIKSQFIFLALVIFFCPTLVHAAVIKPESVDISVEPGGVAVAELAVGNENDVEATITIDIVGVNFDIGGEPSFYELDEQSVKNFVLDKSKITIQPGEVKNVFLTYNAPDQLDNQVIVAGVRFIEQAQNQGGISAQKGFISLVFITVGQGLIQQASLIDFSNSDSFVSHLPINFFVTIRNDGDAVMQPSGYVELNNIFGATVDQIEFNSKMQRVPPGTQRTFLARWGSESEGQGFVDELRQEVKQFSLGVFTAKLNLYPWVESGETDQGVMYSENTFVVLPWRIISLAIGIFALLLIVLKIIKRFSR